MLLNSFSFGLFFFIVFCLLQVERWLGGRLRVRNYTLLIASYVFYGWFDVRFLWILILVTGVNYITGRILLSESCSHRRFVLVISIVLSLLPLVYYKYAGFLVVSLFSLFHTAPLAGMFDSLILPVGISFFTFQALTYTIDIYRKKLIERISLTDFALFVSFFPTVLSGPIEKARNLLPQITKFSILSLTDLAHGVAIFVWGLFKKVVIADRLSEYVDWAYGNVSYVSGSTLALAAVFYSVQIYCDFSGYSDMALGVAKGLGFRITKNFRHPYFVATVKEFWHRWHISLTSWFTEYVYFSLGGSRVRLKAHWIFNISMVFVLSGIWHGAAWNFLIWGCLHALYYLVEYGLGLQRQELRRNWLGKSCSMVGVFLLVTLAWVFFRMEDLPLTFAIIGKIFSDLNGPLSFGASSFTFAATAAMLVIFIIYEVATARRWIQFDAEAEHTLLVRNLGAVLPLLFLISLFGVSSDNFVYFQF